LIIFARRLAIEANAFKLYQRSASYEERCDATGHPSSTFPSKYYSLLLWNSGMRDYPTPGTYQSAAGEPPGEAINFPPPT
jgi:hypothetical protein